MRSVALILAGICGSGCSTLAQPPTSVITKRTLAAVKTPTPPTIDGKVDEALWQTAAKAVGFIDSQNATLVGDQTTAYLLYCNWK